MSTKVLFRWVLIVLLAGIVAFSNFGLMLVHAQCESPQPSSCTTCHTQKNPVSEKGEWHSVHADKDICLNCHGGNGSSIDKGLAHEGLVAQPLGDIYTSCHSCHPDYTRRAAQFAATLQITPASCETPTAIAAANIPGGLPPGGISAPSVLASTHLPSLPFLLTTDRLAAILVFFLIGLGWLGRHRIKV